MKLKMIIILFVAAAALLITGAACNRSLKESAPVNGQTVAYTCPMHPSVKSDQPGACSICGMKLVPAYTNTPATKP